MDDEQIIRFAFFLIDRYYGAAPRKLQVENALADFKKTEALTTNTGGQE